MDHLDHLAGHANEVPGGETGAVDVAEAADADLLTRAREGDAAAFAELYRRHAASVRRQARGSGLDADTAEDLTGEAFARTLRAVRNGGGPRASAREYLLTMVRRLAVGWLAGDREERAAATDLAGVEEWAGEEATLPSAEAQALVQADRSILTEAFFSLPGRWRDVLWRTAVEQEPLSRVGRALGLTTNATAVLAFRAREGLRQAYLQAHVSESLTGREDCRRYARKLGTFIRGSSCSRGLRRHLEECERCRAAYLELVDVNATLRGLLPIAGVGWAAAETAGGGLTVNATTGTATGVGGVGGGVGGIGGLGGAGGVAGKLAIAAAVTLVAGSAGPAATQAGSDSGDQRDAAAPEPDVDDGGPEARPVERTDPPGTGTGTAGEWRPRPAADAGQDNTTGWVSLSCLPGWDDEALIAVSVLGCRADLPLVLPGLGDQLVEVGVGVGVDMDVDVDGQAERVEEAAQDPDQLIPEEAGQPQTDPLPDTETGTSTGTGLDDTLGRLPSLLPGTDGQDAEATTDPLTGLLP